MAYKDKNEYGITRCEHCGRILSNTGLEIDDFEDFFSDPGCDYCRDYEEEDFVTDERYDWL